MAPVTLRYRPIFAEGCIKVIYASQWDGTSSYLLRPFRRTETIVNRYNSCDALVVVACVVTFSCRLLCLLSLVSACFYSRHYSLSLSFFSGFPAEFAQSTEGSTAWLLLAASSSAGTDPAVDVTVHNLIPSESPVERLENDVVEDTFFKNGDTHPEGLDIWEDIPVLSASRRQEKRTPSRYTIVRPHLLSKATKKNRSWTLVAETCMTTQLHPEGPYMGKLVRLLVECAHRIAANLSTEDLVVSFVRRAEALSRLFLER